MIVKDGREHTGLLESDLEQTDKMSVKTFHKLIDRRVASQLKKYPGTNGTVAYIALMDAVYQSFENDTLTPLQRIEEIWFATFFIRVWHHWIKEHETLRLDEHFITDNAELGIEINAHTIINYLLFCKQLNEPSLFLPTLMNSQHNERSFANARSMTGVQNTVINFDILEYLNKATRFEFMDELRILLQDKFEFARSNCKNTNFKDFVFSSNEEIEKAVEKGRKRASDLLEDIGLECEEADFECMVSVPNRSDILPIDEISVADEVTGTDENADESSEADLIFEANTLFSQIGSDFNKVCKYTPGKHDLKNNYLFIINSHFFTGEHKTPRGFFRILTSTGEVMLARKGTVVWLLSKEQTKISNDRLLRFRAPTGTDIQPLISDVNQIMSHISVGDWFVFEEDQCFITAQALGFAYLGGRSKREKECSLKIVPIKVPSHVTNPKGIGIICNKFKISANSKLIILSDSSKVNINKYYSHIKKPVMIGASFKISEETQQYLETLDE